MIRYIEDCTSLYRGSLNRVPLYHKDITVSTYFLQITYPLRSHFQIFGTDCFRLNQTISLFYAKLKKKGLENRKELNSILLS